MPSIGHAWHIRVKGHDLVRTIATLDAFKAAPGYNGMPLLSPFANRLDQTAFHANGRKYNFDVEIGNVRGPIPGTGFSSAPTGWQLVEFKADANGAWVTNRLDFYKNPQYMQQWPFAHTITMTYRVSNGALEVRTRIDNMSAEPMPVVFGYHPVYELPDGNRNDWTVSVDAATHWIEIPQRLPTGETQPIVNFFCRSRPHGDSLKKYALIDDVFTDLIRDANGRATMKLMGGGKELHVRSGTEVPHGAALVARVAGGGRWRGSRRWRRGWSAAPVRAAARERRPRLRALPCGSGAGGACGAATRAAGRRCGAADHEGVHRVRADGRHHQRAEPGAHRCLQGAPECGAGCVLAGELLDDDQGLLADVPRAGRSDSRAVSPLRVVTLAAPISPPPADPTPSTV